MKNIISCVLLLAFTLSAFARDEGLFSVKIGSEGGGRADLMGWDCSNESRIKYQESLPDHRGEKKLRKRKIDIKGDSLFSGDEVSAEFRKEMSVQSAIPTNVSETCTKTIVKTEFVKQCDSTGLICETNLVETEVDHKMHFYWNCTLDRFPQKVGQKLVSTCKPEILSFGNAMVDVDFVYAMKSKKVRAEITLLKRYEAVTVDLCKGRDLSTRKIIKLSQGVDSLTFEDDFVVTVEIPGLNRPIKFKNKDGILNEEIAICRKGPIKMKVTALEEDPIYDDIYTCEKGSNVLTLEAGKAGKNSSLISYKRDNRWDRFFLDKKQQIKVEIKAAPLR